MRTGSIGFGLLAGCLVIACGGDDSTIAPPGSDSGGGPDTATSDSGNNPDSGNGQDASDSSVAPDVNTFQVGNVNGLVLWLDATKGVTTVPSTDGGASTRVAKWADQTTHGNDARGNAGNPSLDPNVVTSGINGLPTVHFDKGGGGQPSNGNELDILDNPDLSLQWGTGDFYLAVVARFDNVLTDGASRGAGTFYSKLSYSGWMSPATGVGLFGNIPPAGNGPALSGMYFQAQSTMGNYVAETTTGYNDGKAHWFEGQRVGTALNLLVDATMVGTATSAINVDSAGTGVTIGAVFYGSTDRLDGDISEIIAVKGTLSASDQAGIEGYLKSKYAL